MDIYNNLPPELQSIIQKKYERILLHERLKEAQRYLSYFLVPRRYITMNADVAQRVIRGGRDEIDVNGHSQHIHFQTARRQFYITSQVVVIDTVDSQYNLNKVIVRSDVRNSPEKDNIVHTELFNLRGYVEYVEFRPSVYKYPHYNLVSFIIRRYATMPGTTRQTRQLNGDWVH